MLILRKIIYYNYITYFFFLLKYILHFKNVSLKQFNIHKKMLKIIITIYSITLTSFNY